MTESAVSLRPTDCRPLIVRYVAQALREWPPLSSAELVGVAPRTTFIGLQLDLIETEYYPFDAVQQLLEGEELDAVLLGIDTISTENQLRLIVAITHDCEIIRGYAVNEK